MVSTRLTLLLLAASLASAATAKPYAPELYSRAALNADGKMAKRNTAASRPYSPELYSRNLVDDGLANDSSSSFAKRSSTHQQERSTSSWSPLEVLGIRSFSEEELHARGKVSDDLIEKRGWCNSDNMCNDDQYCSSKRNRCYQKLDNGKHCIRNGACGSGYCCESDNVCKEKRDIGAKCHGNMGACESGYCSVVTDKCRARSPVQGSCRVDAGCQDGLHCLNGQCVKPKPTKPSKPQHDHKPEHEHEHKPHRPSPSGSPEDKRELRQL